MRPPSDLRSCGLLLLGVLAVTWCSTPAAIEAQDGERPLTIGTKEAPPFSLRTEDGAWEGVSIELWQRIASELDVAYTFQERSIDELVSGVEDGSLDAAVAALTIAPEREARVDFTHPYYFSGLGIAVAGRPRAGWLSVVSRLFTGPLARVVGVLLLVLLAVGTVLWLFERKRNPEQFGGGVLRGLGAGLWWSAVTMTTVGYGDKTPKTVAGRSVALVWMFASIVIITGFIAGISSAVTVSRLQAELQGPDDLPKVRVATVAATTSEGYLQDEGIAYRMYPSPEAAIDALLAGETDALVYDAPILRYFATARFPGRIVVLDQTIERQDYGIALPTGSPLREPMNQIILRSIHEEWWGQLLQRYMGRRPGGGR